MSNDKSYTIDEAIVLLRKNKDLIFEIRDEREKNYWYEHMLLMCTCNIYGVYSLQFYTKPRRGITPYKWMAMRYIPFSEKLKWYVSSLTKETVQKSIYKLEEIQD